MAADTAFPLRWQQEETMTFPEDIVRFVLQRDLCVLATSALDVPHASLMAYVAEEDLSSLYMATPSTTRKWANLCVNPNMSVLMDDREQHSPRSRSTAHALTLGGKHVPVGDAANAYRITSLLTAKHPHLASILSKPGIEIIRLKPQWCLLLTGAEDARYIKLET